jgi:hypothetical protein
MLLCDPGAVAALVRQVEAWPIRQLVVGHGDVLRDDARARTVAALAAFAETKSEVIRGN